jgi:hypothetical protein
LGFDRTSVLKGHDFSRAERKQKRVRALAPEGWFFRCFELSPLAVKQTALGFWLSGTQQKADRW